MIKEKFIEYRLEGGEGMGILREVQVEGKVNSRKVGMCLKCLRMGKEFRLVYLFLIIEEKLYYISIYVGKYW